VRAVGVEPILVSEPDFESGASSTNDLSKRLAGMVETGLLQRCLYSPHPPRFEHVMTPKIEAFSPDIEALLRWSCRDDE
jgi:DNA-binding HxlR family transcriptional regulator